MSLSNLKFKIKTKTIIPILIITSVLSSCSVKKNNKSDSSSSNVLTIEEMQDSDGDGVPDSIEVQRGTNPYIADIPRIKVSFVQSVSMGGSFKSLESEDSLISKDITLPQNYLENQDNKNPDKDYLKALRKKALENQVAQIKNVQADKTDTITNEDLRTSILSDWDNENYYKALDSILTFKNPIDTESGKAILNFKIKLSDTQSVTEVSNIKLKTFFYNYRKMEENDIFQHFLLKEDGTKEKINIYNDKEANPVSLYSIISSDLSILKVADNIKNRNELGLKFTDYDYVSSGIPLNYSTTLQKALDHDAKIIFSTNEKTEVFFVSPIFTLEEALKLLNKKVIKNSVGGIYSINGIETNASLPINLDTVSKKEFKNGVWSIIGDADSLKDKITEKGIYLISYATIGDLVEASRIDQIYPEAKDTISNSLSIEKLVQGDEININVSELYLNTIIESITSESRSTGTINCLNSEPNKPRDDRCFLPLISTNSSCTIIHSSPSNSQQLKTTNISTLKNNVSIKNEFNEEVNFSAYYAGNNIKIIFDKELPMQRNNLTIYLKSPPPSQIRVGVISTDCLGVERNFSLQTIQPSYVFKRDISIYSQIKF